MYSKGVLVGKEVRVIGQRGVLKLCNIRHGH